MKGEVAVLKTYHRAMKVYGGNGTKTHAFLISALDKVSRWLHA